MEEYKKLCQCDFDYALGTYQFMSDYDIGILEAM